MPATKSPEVCDSLCITSPDTMNGIISQEIPFSNAFATVDGKGKNDEILKKFVEECTNRGIEVVDEELMELDTYLNFLSHHITTGNETAVPCMLLWSEWAKFCTNQTQKYPGFIYEQEFRYLILRQFNLRSREDIASGPLYPGVQFVADKKRMMERVTNRKNQINFSFKQASPGNSHNI
jgi:hypothetical protein